MSSIMLIRPRPPATKLHQVPRVFPPRIFPPIRVRRRDPYSHLVHTRMKHLIIRLSTFFPGSRTLLVTHTPPSLLPSSPGRTPTTISHSLPPILLLVITVTAVAAATTTDLDRLHIRPQKPVHPLPGRHQPLPHHRRHSPLPPFFFPLSSHPPTNWNPKITPHIHPPPCTPRKRQNPTEKNRPLYQSAVVLVSGVLRLQLVMQQQRRGKTRALGKAEEHVLGPGAPDEGDDVGVRRSDEVQGGGGIPCQVGAGVEGG